MAEHHPGPEVVVCPVCGEESSVKISGTMPLGWMAVWRSPGDYPRVCSVICLNALKDHPEEDGGSN